MTPRGRRGGPARSPPQKALAETVAKAVKQTVRPLGGFSLGIAVSIVTDEEGRPCGTVVATSAPAPARVPGAIDVEVEADEGQAPRLPALPPPE